jgi:hypothetical protein
VSGSEVDAFAALDSRHKYKASIQRSKRSAWQSFLNNLHNTQAMARLVKSLFRPKDSGVGFLMREDGSYCDGPSEAADLLMDTFFEGSSSVKPPQQPNSTQQASLDQTGIITVPKVREAF